MEVIVKKLYHQEIGGRRGVNDRAGKYIYIPSTYPVGCLAFFPALSQYTLHDSAMLSINGAECQYIYYNDKLFDMGTRNERRIYINNDLLNPGGNYFEVDDIIVIVRENNTNAYRMYHFDVTSLHYDQLSNIINTYCMPQNIHLVIVQDTLLTGLGINLNAPATLPPSAP